LAKLSPQQLTSHFTVQEIVAQESAEESLAKLVQAGEQNPALLLKTRDQMLLLTINEQGKQRMTHSGHTLAWNNLDVAIAQKLILEERLGLSPEDIAAGKSIRYAHHTQEAWQAIQHNQAQAVILLNSIPLPQVCAVAQADERMPQKSTYLYPKLATGLVMNPLW
jgi:hypothetical protein